MSANTSYELAQVFLRLFMFMKPRKSDQLIKPTEMMVLTVVCRGSEFSSDGIIPSEICDELGLSKSGLTALLNSLEQRGYIKRELSSSDRRKIIVRGTEKAEEIHNQFHNGVNNSFAGLSDYLGEKDAEELLKLLDRTYSYLKSRKG